MKIMKNLWINQYQMINHPKKDPLLLKWTKKVEKTKKDNLYLSFDIHVSSFLICTKKINNCSFNPTIYPIPHQITFNPHPIDRNLLQTLIWNHSIGKLNLYVSDLYFIVKFNKTDNFDSNFRCLNPQNSCCNRLLLELICWIS